MGKFPGDEVIQHVGECPSCLASCLPNLGSPHLGLSGFTWQGGTTSHSSMPAATTHSPTLFCLRTSHERFLALQRDFTAHETLCIKHSVLSISGVSSCDNQFYNLQNSSTKTLKARYLKGKHNEHQTEQPIMQHSLLYILMTSVGTT